MKKIYSLLAATLISACVTAQTTISDSVSTGPTYANAVFYSMANGTMTTPTIKNADIQIRYENLSASIRAVDGWAGAQTYLPVLNDTTQWATLDSTGMTAVYNSDNIWENGSFNTTATGHPSYGWGTYNSTNHNIYGNKLFIFRTQTNNYKKVWVKMLNSVPKIYTIRYANLDGSMDTTVNIGAADFAGQNFGYYSFDTHTKLNAEPTGTAWDIVFRKYLRSSDNYPVMGVMTNLNVKSAEAWGVADPYTTTGSGLTYIDDISNIGADWKTFSPPTGPWVIEDSLAYFVLTQDTKIWRIIFTGFGGSGTGKVYFSKTQVYDPTGIASVNTNILSATVYPNPYQSNSVLLFDNRMGTKTSVDIFSMNGQLVHSEKAITGKGLNQYPIGQLNLDNGIYIIKISDGVESTNLKLVVAD